ncbi:MAG TPA: hypothetical protein VJT82_09605, partial [Pyrinomonadaceae bacterium]|nr:hypothetical protein [Pyrinomonadaceae bacterium]
PAPPATEAAEVSDAAPVEQTQGAHIIIDVDATAAAAALTTPTTSVMGNVWSLGCDTEAYETESESADEQ